MGENGDGIGGIGDTNERTGSSLDFLIFFFAGGLHSESDGLGRRWTLEALSRISCRFRKERIALRMAVYG